MKKTFSFCFMMLFLGFGSFLHSGAAAVMDSSTSINEKLSSTSLTEPDIYDRAAYRSWLLKLKNSRDADFLTKSEIFIASDPTASGTAQLQFKQMKALRRQEKWSEARMKANEIVKTFPDSPEATSMGGSNGLNEDHAALAFAQISSHYHASQFDLCIANCEKFITEFPNNWRRGDVYTTWCYCLYHTGQWEEFKKVGHRAISQKAIKQRGGSINRLQAAIYIKSGQFDKARSVLDELEKTGSKAHPNLEAASLRFDSYFYQNRFADLGNAANAFLMSQTTGTRGWQTGLMWRAVALANGSPADFNGATHDLNLIVERGSKTDDPQENVRTTALYWKAWIADRTGDITAGRSAMAEIRDKMPAGSMRTRALSKFSNLLDPAGR